MATTSRIAPATATNQDTTARVLTRDYQSPVYAATLAVKTVNEHTLVKVGPLTGNITITAGIGSATTGPYVGDTITFLFNASGGARTVTFSTGFSFIAATMVIASGGSRYKTFMFDGAAWAESQTTA